MFMLLGVHSNHAVRRVLGAGTETGITLFANMALVAEAIGPTTSRMMQEQVDFLTRLRIWKIRDCAPLPRILQQ